MSQDSITPSLYEAMTQAIEAGWSINRIAQEAGVARTSLQQWYTGARPSLNIETAGKLAAWLGMRLTKAKIPRCDEGGEKRKPAKKSSRRQ